MQIKFTLAIFGASLALGGAAFAAVPQAMHQGDVTYLTGGIGLNSQRAMEAQAPRYDLAVTNANEQGEFTGQGTALTIQAKNGRDILHVTGIGPLFYAKLPPGNYVIHASNDGQYRTRDVKIIPNQATDVHLIWPQRG